MIAHVLLLSPNAERYRAAISAPESIRLICAERKEDALSHASKISAVVTFPGMLDKTILNAMPQIQWIQALTSGIDAFQTLPLRQGIRLTNARGVQADQLSELVFLQMLWFTRDVPAMLEHQRTRVWSPRPQRLLAGKNILIVGIGAISEELARRCLVFGMNVTGCSASRSQAPGFDRIFPFHSLSKAVATADFVVVLTPDRPENRKLISRRVIAEMAPHAVLVNVSRGRVVDEEAVIDALKRHRIGGAALDVFHTEPLPSANPLWECDRVLITPHIGGFSETHADQIGPLISENLRKWAQKSFPLINEVQLR